MRDRFDLILLSYVYLGLFERSEFYTIDVNTEYRFFYLIQFVQIKDNTSAIVVTTYSYLMVNSIIKNQWL
jgi:hypothetical protein